MKSTIRFWVFLVCVTTIALYGAAFAQRPTEQETPQEPAVEKPAEQDTGQKPEGEEAAEPSAKEALFKEAAETFEQAKEKNADLFSPAQYAQAQRDFAKAQQLYDAGDQLQAVYQNLASSMKALQSAMTTAELGQVALKDVLILRKETLDSGLSFDGSKDFQEAEKKFREAVEKIEKDRDTKGALKPSEQAAEKYRKTVVQVLLKGVLPDAKNKLKASKDAYSKDAYKEAENSLKDFEKYVKAESKKEFSVAELTSIVARGVETALKPPAAAPAPSETS